MKYIIFFFVVALGVGSCKAQTSVRQSVDKKALNYLNEARIALNQGQFAKGAEYLNIALGIQPDYLDANNTLGYLYLTQLNQPDKAIECLEKVIKTDPNYDPNTYLLLGKAYTIKKDYAKAKNSADDMLALPAEKLSDRLKFEAKRIKENADFAEYAYAHPVPFKPENLGPSVNTTNSEYFPALTADNAILYFTIGDKSKGMIQEDLAYSTFETNAWKPVIRLPMNINDPTNNEGAHTISPNGKYLFYTSCNKPDGIGSCDLYICKREGFKWGDPRNLGAIVNSRGWESQPSISGDGKELYFVRRVGNHTDIFVSKLDEKTGFQTPVALGAEINTPGSEERPFIHPDNQTLYFISDGLPGLGQHDIFMSKRNADGSWGKAVNLGYPINTEGDEFGIFVTSDGKKAYFSSERAGGFGDLDIYSFELPESVKPSLVTYVKGSVVDAETKSPLSANVQLYDVESGIQIMTMTSDPINGQFMVTLPIGKNYLCNVSKDGYLFYSDNFSLENQKALDPFEVNIALNKVKEGVSIVLKNIFFETNKYVLLPESKTELNKLVDLLKKNPGIKMEIGGHTDNVGNDADNLKLSENRSKSVVQYLVENGIETSRLSAKGYGETMPIADNNTDTGRAQNRRTEFKITAR